MRCRGKSHVCEDVACPIKGGPVPCNLSRAASALAPLGVVAAGVAIEGISDVEHFNDPTASFHQYSIVSIIHPASLELRHGYRAGVVSGTLPRRHHHNAISLIQIK
jgi:hypothetical protein